MSVSRSQTPSPRISPLPRLESYASYSSTPDRLWDGHDPVRLAAREASIRARMVARARARASEENEKAGSNEGGSEVLLDEYGRHGAEARSIGPTTPNLPTTPTPKSPLKPLILASSATLPRSGRTSPSPNDTPRSVTTTNRKTVTRRPSAVELKYSPINSPQTAPQTPVSVLFVTAQSEERDSSLNSIPLGQRTSETWSYRSSDYLAPSPSSFGTSPRIARSPVSPNLLSPSYASSTSPTSAFFRSTHTRRDPIPPASPDVWDDEEQWKRLSSYLIDPYRPSPDISPVRSARDRTASGRGDVSTDEGRRALVSANMQSASDSPRHASTRGETRKRSPDTRGLELSTVSRLWEPLPPLPVEPPSKAVSLQRSKSKDNRNAGQARRAAGEEALLPREAAVRRETSGYPRQTDRVKRRDLPIMAKMSIMEERLRKIGQKWTNTTDPPRMEDEQSRLRSSSPPVDQSLGRVANTSDLRLSSAASLADVAKGKALEFPIPPVRTAKMGATSPAWNPDQPSPAGGLPDHAYRDRQPSASTSNTVAWAQSPDFFESRANNLFGNGKGKTQGLNSPLLGLASLEMTWPRSPTLPIQDRAFGPISPTAIMQAQEHDRSSHETGINAQETTIKPKAPRTVSHQTAVHKPNDWLVPPQEDIADWGDLEIIGRR
ncbi:hypothetical protein NliqN6_1264 [Naganishia liquefaciens]|uniref:Uncharacterized protein n=1 Tax=Naganishia liquefaciens TaxID=104408 RepID=A0A8H3TPK6_9TREE|nr:hypothetical protein NliqN6_1264 [Naganishia liquefaciens]